jgi:phosphoglycerol transferase MdoB-like AlkP superfamily enzyme
MKHRTEVFFRNLIGLSVLFILHRALSFDLLSIELLPGKEAAAKSILIGIISDFWVATLFALVILLFQLAFGAFKTRTRNSNSDFIWLLTAMGLLLVMHQSYVEFFRHSIAPSHLAYLSDRQFLAANGSSALSLRAIALAILFAMAIWLIRWIKLEFRPSRKFRFAIVLLTVVISILLHSFQVNYRRRWLIPDRLQSNLFEKLHSSLAIAVVPPAISTADWQILTSLIGESHKSEMGSYDFSFMLRPVSQRVDDRFAEVLRLDYQNAVKNRRSPMIIVVLMESMRPSETGWHNPNGLSVTPVFDQLAAEGIGFINAYATGTVTRAGQEAVFCGYLSGQNTSMMRNRPDVQMKCLPEILGATATAPFSFWFHGGDGEFDNQQSFWIRQNVRKTIARKQFDASIASTSWGVGDISLMRRSLQEISDARVQGFTQALGMILTVTNHIPWKIPGDAPNELGNPELLDRHPSYRTTAYADFALGELVAGFRKSRLWDDLVLIVASDHGVLMDPLNEPNVPTEIRGAELYSHIVLALSGGLVEAAISKSKINNSERKRIEFVSQADVAPFISYLVGEDGAAFLGEQLFLGRRKAPVITDLGHSVFMPELGKILTQKEVVEMNSAQLEPETRNGMIYYRSFLHLLDGKRYQTDLRH